MPATLFPVNPNTDLAIMLSVMAGQRDGISRGYGGEGVVTEQAPNSLSVDVASLIGFIDDVVIHLISTTAVGPIVAPVGGASGDFRRIDLVQYTLYTGLNIKTGVESGSPAVPTTDTSSIVLKHIYSKNGTLIILNTEVGNDAYLVNPVPLPFF